jgi:hypothetical protein
VKKLINIEKLESGQVIPLVVLMMFAIIGMVALVLDGGALMANRRAARAAADAGAMAGSQHLCYSLPDPVGTARAYAIQNGADPDTLKVTIGENNNQITVEAWVIGDSFFAKIFGVQTLRASGEATSGCFGPRGKGVIPLAWRCWPPPQEGDPDYGEPYPFNEKYGCQMQTLEWAEISKLIDGTVSSLTIADFYENEEEYHMHTDGTSIVRDPDPDNEDETVPIPPKQIYIMFDGDKICVEDGGTGYVCDLDGDDKKDLQLGGDRGLVYLTSKTTNINDWITSDTQPDITLQAHVWLTAKSGVASAVGKMESSGWSGEVVLIPIFNEICETDPTKTPGCITKAHASPPWPEFHGEDRFDMKPGGSLWYHIIAFQPFYISCVSDSGNCPGYRHAQFLNKDNENKYQLKDNVPVVEGYFLSDYDDLGLDGQMFCDINLGNCDISLSK